MALSKAQAQTIQSLYKSGMVVRDIATAVGCGHSTVYTYIKPNRAKHLIGPRVKVKTTLKEIKVKRKNWDFIHKLAIAEEVTNAEALAIIVKKYKEMS